MGQATAWLREEAQLAVGRKRLRLDRGAGQEHLRGDLRERQMGAQLGPGQPMIPVPAWASRGSIAPGQRFCTRTVSDHAEQDGDGDDRHHEAGHGRAELLELLSPSSTVSYATGLRSSLSPKPGQDPLSLRMASPVVTVCTSSSTGPAQKSLHATVSRWRPPVSTATPRRTWIHPGRDACHRAGPGRTRARRWPRVRCGADRPGRLPRSPGSTSPGHGCGPR
jgi:hypothetical protein